MAETSKIAWCDSTANFWWGCTKISPGCAHCYAEGVAHRFGGNIWGKAAPRMWILSTISMVRKLERKAAKDGKPVRGQDGRP